MRDYEDNEFTHRLKTQDDVIEFIAMFEAGYPRHFDWGLPNRILHITKWNPDGDFLHWNTESSV